jgi:hypothetical protein
MTRQFLKQPHQGVDIHELPGIAVVLCASAERAGEVTVVREEEFEHFWRGCLTFNNLSHFVADDDEIGGSRVELA